MTTRTATPTDQKHRSQEHPMRAAWRASGGGLVAIVLFGAFINLLKFAVPLYALQIFDRVPASRSIETLIMLTMMALLAAGSGVALEAVRRRMLSRWGGWIERYFGPQLLHAGITRREGRRAPGASRALGDLAALRTFVERAAGPMLDVVWAPAQRSDGLVLPLPKTHKAKGEATDRLLAGLKKKRLVAGTASKLTISAAGRKAYIKSQRHKGWVALTDVYDDGGFSGGTMERPALQRLIADIQDGRVNVVVVYKVDRLTRSLSDFARIVEAFDARKVSFVSVTQQFNTTSSMGRLTLNMLLSFAQFER